MTMAMTITFLIFCNVELLIFWKNSLGYAAKHDFVFGCIDWLASEESVLWRREIQIV